MVRYVILYNPCFLPDLAAGAIFCFSGKEERDVVLTESVFIARFTAVRVVFLCTIVVEENPPDSKEKANRYNR